MDKKEYDIIVVGAGPAGIFACLELIKLNKKFKIALIEKGDRIEDRKINSVMFGFGGAGTYSDGKLHYSPVLSHERVLHLIEVDKYQRILDEVDQIFMDNGVDSEEYPKGNKEVEKLVEEAQIHDIELIVRRIKHVGTDKLKKIISKFQSDLEKSGVEIITNTVVEDIIMKKSEVIGVQTSKGDYYSDKVLVAPGRGMAEWFQKMCDKNKVEYIFDMVEVGVRVEFPSYVMRRHAEILYEIAFKIRTTTFDDIIRTFCPNPNGFVAIERYENFICVNGYSNSDHVSKNSNFAFLSEVHLTEPVENSMLYAKSIAELATTIGGGKPVLQRLADLRKGRRTTESRLKKSLITPTLKEYTPGDISMALPHRVVTNIIEGLEIMENVMPGINTGSTLLYAPEVKFRSSKIKTDVRMETSIKNLFVAGDASGMAGSITGAAATGIMAARGMV